MLLPCAPTFSMIKIIENWVKKMVLRKLSQGPLQKDVVYLETIANRQACARIYRKKGADIYQWPFCIFHIINKEVA